MPLPVRRGKDLQDLDVSDLRYLESNNVYSMRYDRFFLTYLPSGKLESVVDLGQKHQCVLVPERGWVVKQMDEARMETTDLQGRTLEDFAHPKGNTKFAFSPYGTCLVAGAYHGKFALAWSRQFQNTYHKPLHRKLALHAGKFLTQQSKTEVLLYEQE